jgi:PAS domain S-box-containing protein
MPVGKDEPQDEPLRARLVLLAQAGREITRSLDLAATLDAVARVAVSGLADWCLVDLVDADGALRTVAAAHADPEQEPLVRRLQREYPADDDQRPTRRQVAQGDRPLLISVLTDDHLIAAARDAEHLDLLRSLEPRSTIAAPLIARGRTLGTLLLVARRPGAYAERDLAWIETLADHCALAIETATLFEAEIRAREDAVEAHRRTEGILESITDAFCSVDGDWRYSYVNRRALAMTGLTSDELLGMRIWDVYPQLVDTPLYHAAVQAMDQRIAAQAEHNITGTGRWLSVRAYPSEQGVSLYFQDITDRKQAEQARYE